MQEVSFLLQMDKWIIPNSVNEEQYKNALESLQKAIDKKDTPAEWAHWTLSTMFLVGKLVISQMGYGPAIALLEQIFGKDDKLLGVLKILLKEKTNA